MKLAKTVLEATLAVARLAGQSLSPVFLTLAGSRFRRWYMRFWSPRQRPTRLNVPLVLSGFVALHEQRFLHEPPPLTARCVHDKLLFYAVSFNTRIHPVYIPYTEAYIAQHYKQGDERGRFHTAPLTAQGIRHGHSGKPWGGVDVTARSLHWVCPTALPDGLELPEKWVVSQFEIRFL